MKRTPSLRGKQSQAKTTPNPEYAMYRDPILKGKKKAFMLFIPRLLLLEKKKKKGNFLFRVRQLAIK